VASRQIRFAISLCFLLMHSVHEGFAEPFRSAAAGVVLVAATVDGQAGIFLLDTGTERSCLDTGFAARLPLKSTVVEGVREPYRDASAEDIRIRDFGLGSFHLQNVAMLSTDLSTPFSRTGLSIDGILGTDVLRRFIVRVDFSSGSAQFGMKGTFPVGAKVVKLEPVDDLYFVPLSIQGTSTKLLLDTGTNSTSISSTAWSRITTHWQPLSKLDGVRSTGSSENAHFVLAPRISIGGSSSRDVPLRIQPRTEQGLFADPDFDGLLGSDVLQQFIVTLDLANNKMYLTHNPNNHINRYLFSTIGIQFAKDADEGFTIMAVWNPSPAATAGLKIGDRILAVNQLDTRRLSLDDLSREIHGQPGTEVTLVIDSAGHRHSVPVAISCLLCPGNTNLQNAK
jgi:predicted aspartyl protease